MKNRKKKLIYTLGFILIFAIVASCSSKARATPIGSNIEASPDSSLDQTASDRDSRIESLLFRLRCSIYNDLFAEEWRSQLDNSKTVADDYEVEFIYRNVLHVLSVGYGWRDQGALKD